MTVEPPVLPKVYCPACHRCLFEGIYLAIDKICPRCKRHFRHTLPLENFPELAQLLTALMQCGNRLS